MKTLLIWPPMTIYPPDPKVPSASPPLGLAYIAAVLEKEGYEVKILDALALGINTVEKRQQSIRVGMTNNEIKKYFRNFSPDVVGISSMFTGYVGDVHNCARIVKEVDQNLPVIVGGAHASVDPHEMLDDRNIDIVVKGEGEYTFLELVRKLEENKNIHEIAGTVIRNGDRIFHNTPRQLIENLDLLPFPARHLLPMDVYLKHTQAYGDYIMRQPSVGMTTSRGCPRNCVFCSIHSVWGHTWRGRSAGNVVDEIEYLVDRYHTKEIAFLDDNLTLDRKRILRICDEIKRREIDIKWCTPNGVAISTLNKEVIKKMKKSGCYRLTFGIESGDSETQKFIGKTTPLDHTRSMIKYANRIGMWTISTFILGFPFESERSIRNTIDYAVRCDTDFALFYILAPFPGTPVHEWFREKGLIDKSESKNLGYILNGGGLPTEFLGREEVKEWQNRASSEFLRYRIYSFLNPLRILRKINSFEDLLYTVRIAKNAIRMLGRLRQARSEETDVKSQLYGRLGVRRCA